MARTRIVIVGNGRMAQNCAAILLDHADVSLLLVAAEKRRDPAQSRLAGFCRKREVPLLLHEGSINDRAIVARVAAERPDLILSIDNLQIFDNEILSVPARGCINFHNGPIERYRGVHVPSWAILNGEPEHGVTWHYMERAVDAGAIAAARTFPLTGSETALSLTLECIRIGTEVFEEGLESVLAGVKSPVLASPAAKLYRRSDKPNGGILDLREPASQIDRVLRATDFRPLENPFTYARLQLPRGDLIVNEARPVADNRQHRPGDIVTAAGDELVVACADRLLAIRAVMLAPDEEASIADAIRQLELAPGTPSYPEAR
jgi:methionyl-tRNA formyltransferase